MTETKTNAAKDQTNAAPKKRVIVIGRKVNGRWQVRTSLWRYLASTALSNQ